MDKKELSQYHWLKREIEADEQRLNRLRDKASSPKTSKISAMPHGGSPGSATEAIVAEITDLEAIIAAKQIQCIHQRQMIERFICSLPDSLTRMVFTYRCIDGMTWREVAAAMGHKMSEENARQIFHRTMRAQNRNSD